MQPEEIINIAHNLLALLKDRLNYSDESIAEVQKEIDKMKTSQMDYADQELYLLAFAIYIGEIILKKIKGTEFKFTFADKQVVDLSVIDPIHQVKANVYTWVKRYYQDPAGNNLAEKFLVALDTFGKSS